jgi:hypothetical protein
MSISFGELICAAANDEILWLTQLMQNVQLRHGLSKDDPLEGYLTPAEKAGVQRIRDRLVARVVASRKPAEISSSNEPAEINP